MDSQNQPASSNPNFLDEARRKMAAIPDRQQLKPEGWYLGEVREAKVEPRTPPVGDEYDACAVQIGILEGQMRGVEFARVGDPPEGHEGFSKPDGKPDWRWEQESRLWKDFCAAAIGHNTGRGKAGAAARDEAVAQALAATGEAKFPAATAKLALGKRILFKLKVDRGERLATKRDVTLGKKHADGTAVKVGDVIIYSAKRKEQPRNNVVGFLPATEGLVAAGRANGWATLAAVKPNGHAPATEDKF